VKRLLLGDAVLVPVEWVEVVDTELALFFSGPELAAAAGVGVDVDVDCKDEEGQSASDSDALRRISRSESWADEEDEERVDRKVGKRIIFF